jgi:AcrR family transcriptional regulator
VADRRAEIIAAAITLFSDRGYADVGMVDIAAACQLSTGALYLSFENKVALLDAVCIHFMAEVEAHLRTSLSVDDAPHVRFERRMTSHAQFVVENRDLLRVIRRDVEHLPRSSQSRIWADTNRLMRYWIEDLILVRPELSREDACIAAFAGLAVLQSTASFPSPVEPGALVTLLATAAAAAQLALPPAH